MRTWLRHDLHHFFITDEKRKRYAVALSQKCRQRNHSPNVFFMLQSAVHPPHFLVRRVCIQATSIRCRHNKRKRVAATAAIHDFQSVAQLCAGLEIIEQTRICVYTA